MQIDRVSWKGNGAVNEDSVGGCQGFFWVLDGSTPITAVSVGGSFLSQAEWLVSNTTAYFTKAISAEPGIREKEMFDRLSEYLANSKGQYRIADLGTERPSMTLAMVSVKESKAILSVVGDCSIYVLTKRNRVMKFTDRRVNRYSKKTLAVFVKNQNSPDLKELVDEQRKKNQRKINRPGGYWVANESRDWIDQVKTKKIKLSEVRAILVCSDGFDRVFHPFCIYDPLAIMEGRIGLEEALERLRSFELSDPNQMKFPRLKVSDDATCVLIRELAP